MKKKTIKKSNKTSLQKDVQELKDIIFPTLNESSLGVLWGITVNRMFNEDYKKEDKKRNKITDLEDRIENLSTKLNKLEEYLGINYCEDNIALKKYSKLENWNLKSKIRNFIENL